MRVYCALLRQVTGVRDSLLGCMVYYCDTLQKYLTGGLGV